MQLFWRLIVGDPGLGQTVESHYNLQLVAMSVFIASLAGFAALSIADRLAASTRKSIWWFWLITGATVMGCGIWSMHFTAMLAFTLQCSTCVMRYDLLITIVSVVPGILGAAAAMYAIARSSIGWKRFQLSALSMAVGIGGMHYVGMEAMQMNDILRYDLWLFILSIVVAHVLAMIALYIRFILGATVLSARTSTKVIAAVFIGFAVSGMHYTAMAAARFFPGPPSVPSGLLFSPIGMGSSIFVVTSLILVCAIVAVRINWRFEQSETARRKSEQRLGLALEASGAGLWDWELKSGLMWSNDQLHRMLGEVPIPNPMNIEWLQQRLHPEDYTRMLQAIEQMNAGGSLESQMELRLRTADGSFKWVRSHNRVGERDAQGQVSRIVGLYIDIDSRVRIEAELRESRERFELAVRGSREGLWDWDLATGKVYYAPRWKELLGIPETQVCDSPEVWFNRITSSNLSEFHADLQSVITGRADSLDRELPMLHSDGGIRWMLCRAAAVRDQAGKAVRLAGSLAEITELKEAQAQLRRMAQHDRLTDLPNRELMTQKIQHSIAQTKRNADYRFAVLFFDFDRFKVINDSLGHKAGDNLLRGIADRFRLHTREVDTAARFGGDEFVVLLDGIHAASEAEEVCKRLVDIFSEPHHLDGHIVVSTASIGMVTSETGYEDAEEMIRDADAAMYQAKVSGKCQYRTYDAKMREDGVKRLSMEEDLRGCLFDDEFKLAYQPIVSLESGQTTGFEALARWHHPTKGLISPGSFIPVAEESGLIVPLGRWVLRTAIQQLKQWHDQTGRTDIVMNINVSKRQLIQPDFINELRGILNETGVDAASVCLEITETAIMDERHDMTSLLKQIKELRVQLAMDDFGTGESSLSCLQHFPLNVLKIDRSFIMNMEEHREFSAVMQAIIMLAQNLNLDVVAEGIENHEQLAQLQTMDCRKGQGFLFAKPVSADDASEFISSSYQTVRSKSQTPARASVVRSAR